MGNEQSQHGHHSRRQTPTNEHERKRRSLSPSKLGTSHSDILQNRTSSALSNTQNSSSFHSTTDSQHQAAKRRIQQRRAKSFRVAPNRARGSFRITVCSVTGMTDNQKQLVKQMWFGLEKPGGIFEFGSKVFLTLFNRDRKFLRAVGLSHLADHKPNSLKVQMNFRVHVQRFCETLNTVIRQFDEPKLTISMLHEFGASHLKNYENDRDIKSQKLPAAYWESLVFAINNAAKDLQVESSRGSESPRNTFDKRFLLPGDDLSLGASSICTPSASPSPTPFSLGPSTPRRYNSVCPTAAEAWSVFATYIVGQIRFGFEMERLLQTELHRLLANSLQLSWQLPSDDNNTFSSREDSTLDGLSIQTNTTALHGGGSISSTSNSSNSSSGSSANVYTSDLPTIIQQNGNLTMAALVE